MSLNSKMIQVNLEFKKTQRRERQPVKIKIIDIVLSAMKKEYSLLVLHQATVIPSAEQPENLALSHQLENSL